MPRDENLLRLTLIVGIRCSDGVVVAAERAVTFVSKDRHTITHLVCKISILSDSLIVAGYGQSGVDQRFCEVAGKVWSDIGTDEEVSSLSVGRILCAHAIKDFDFTKLAPGKFGALVAFPHVNDGPQLCEFSIADFQPDLKDAATWFVAAGSGQLIADAYLALVREAFWGRGMPTLREGTFAVAWVMRQSIKAAPIMIAEPIDIAILQGGRARMLDPDELDRNLRIADHATRHFGAFDPLSSDNAATPSELPSPEPAATSWK